MKRALGLCVWGEFMKPMATDAERAVLAAASPPIEAPESQDYIVWRRALLWVATALFAVGCLFKLIGFTTITEQMVEGAIEAQRAQSAKVDEAAVRKQIEELADRTNLTVLDVWQWLDLLAILGATVLAGIAARRWLSVSRSRRHARQAWMCVVLVPLVLAIVPWLKMTDFSSLGENAETVRRSIAMMLGVFVILTIAPKLLSVFPGLVRSGLLLKTLFHESPIPAYIAAGAAPLFALLSLVVFATLIQMEGKITLFFAVAFFLGSALLYVLRVPRLMRAMDKASAGNAVRSLRAQAGALAGMGGVMLFVFLVQLDSVPVASVLEFLAIGGANLLLTMVVGSDALIHVMVKEHQISEAFHERSELHSAYGDKLASLVTDTATAQAAPTPREGSAPPE